MKKSMSRRFLSSKKMKLCLLASLFPVAGFSKGFAWECNPEYCAEYRAGYGTTTKVDGVKAYVGRTFIGTIQGVKLNQYAQIGLGVDAVMFTHYYKNDIIRSGFDVYGDIRGCYPLSDNFKVLVDVGLGSFTGIKTKNTDTDTSFFCQFGPGIQYKKFTLTTGLQHVGEDQNTFYASIGFTL